MFKKLLLCLLTTATYLFSGTIVDSELDYAITLPDGWVKEIVSPGHHRYYDTTNVFKSYIALVRYDISSSETFDNPHEWARANYLAYLISIQCTMSPQGEALSDPFGIPLYYDSSNVKQNDSLWAAEIYSTFFTTDTQLGSWSEFIRYTGKDDFGYELYAIGDTADMNENIGYYAAIIEMITINTASVHAIPAFSRAGMKQQSFTITKISDLLGRGSAFRGYHRCSASGVIMDAGRKIVLIK